MKGADDEEKAGFANINQRITGDNFTLFYLNQTKPKIDIWGVLISDGIEAKLV